MRLWLVLSIAVLVALLAVPLRAGVPETPRLRVIGVAQGLPSSDIKALARDRAGYIWVATADGLARHDGVGVDVWRYDPSKADSLPGNLVQALHVDADDRVWVAVEDGGLLWLDADRRRLHRVDFSAHPALRDDDIWALAGDGRDLWFGTFANGVYRVRMGDNGRPQVESMASTATGGLPSDTVLDLDFDGEGTLWIATDKGLARHRPGQGTQLERLPGDAPAPMVFSVSVLADGVWAGTAKGVFQRLPDGRWRQPAWSPMLERPNAMMGIALDRDGSHWIISQRGLWRTRGETAPVPVPLGGPGIPRVIPTMLLEDSGALWVPVYGAGLGHLRSDWRRLAQFTQQPLGLRGEMYQGVAAARAGGAWLAGYNGEIERIDRAGTLHAFGEHLRQRLFGTRFSTVEEDSGGRLWLGHRNGLVRIGADQAVDEWRPDSPTDAVPRGMVTQLRQDGRGGLWLVAAGGGVQYRDQATGRVLLDLPAGDSAGLGLADIEALTLDRQGQPWLGGSDGVLRWDPHARRFAGEPALGGTRVFALDFDADGDLWLQRLSGLARYRRGDHGWRLVEQVGVEQGLPALGAAALVVDRSGKVWVSTSRGLYCWQPQARLLQRWGVQDGLGSQEFLDRALALADDGMLVAASNDGAVLLVDTDLPPAPASIPVLRIDGAWVRRHGNWEAIDHATGVVLPPGERELRLRARLLAHDDPAANRYWSLLEGFDNDWVPHFGGAQRVYSSLPPGQYRMRVRATDAAGNAAVEQVLPVTVLPPWWTTWWARLLALLLVLLLLALSAQGYRQRLRRQHAWALAEQQRRMAEQASQAKTRFLATLGHEVRTPMTGVLGMSELLLDTDLDGRQRGHVQSIRRAGEHLLRLVDDALDLARVEAGRLELHQDDFELRALVDEIVDLVAPLADRRGLQFAERIDPATPTAVRGDRTRVQQILLNLLGNAVKFTERGHVLLEVAPLAPVGVRFSVIDTGPGLNEEQKQRLFRRFEQVEGARTAARYGGSGLGLAISQELAAAMGGSIVVDGNPGGGSIFHVELPLPLADAPVPAASPPSQAPGGDALDLLLVEDDATVAEVLVGLLRAQGHRVVHAAHGLAALGEVATRRFDLALLDLDLPGMDGMALARQLRMQGFAAPLLAITARADADAEPQAHAAGFDGFVRKPLTGAMLAASMRALLPQAARPPPSPQM